jgi:hypothetical protein
LLKVLRLFLVHLIHWIGFKPLLPFRLDLILSYHGTLFEDAPVVLAPSLADHGRVDHARVIRVRVHHGRELVRVNHCVSLQVGVILNLV